MKCMSEHYLTQKKKKKRPKKGQPGHGDCSDNYYLRREDDTRANTTGARVRGETLSVDLGVHAGRVGVSSKVGSRKAAVARLHVAAEASRLAAGSVTSKHAESLDGKKSFLLVLAFYHMAW